MGFDYIGKVRMQDGTYATTRFIAGRVVRVKDEEGRPLRFDMSVYRGKNRDTTYVNNIAVSNQSRLYDIVKNLKKGQQLFVVVRVVESEKLGPDGEPYKNLWLHALEFGKPPFEEDPNYSGETRQRPAKPKRDDFVDDEPSERVRPDAAVDDEEEPVPWDDPWNEDE